jgi:HK97 family phage major capsid protein
MVRRNLAAAYYAPELVVKQFAAGAAPRRLTGIASTPTPDRAGDIIDPLGMTFEPAIPLLLNHNQEEHVGTATLTATAEGITFDATFHDVSELPPGRIRQLVEETYAACKAGIYRKVSIAIGKARALVEPLKGGGLRFKSGEILELSLVTVPANRDAGILTVKALDAPPGGRMTIADQIEALEIRKSNARNRMNQILDQAQDDNRTCTPEESSEHDALAAEFKRLDEDLSRWKEREVVNKSLAVAPGAAPPAKPTPAFVPITVKSRLPPGTVFTRLAMCKLYGQGHYNRECDYAKQFKDTPEVEAIIKAAVAVGTTTDATWAGPLVPTLQTITAEFLTLLRPATLIGRIPGIVTVPFNVRIPAQTGGGTYGWVGEGLSKPVTALAFSTVTLGMHKAAGIVVFTEELARNSSPAVEEVVRRDMINGIAAFLDHQFITASVAAVAGVNPASITNGVTPIVSGDNVIADLRAVFAALAAANLDPAGGSLLMSPANAFALATLLASGMFVFPNITMEGGTVVGVNVVTSQVMADNVVFIAKNCVFVADGGLIIDASREATVQMDTAPATPPISGTTTAVSLWQQNLVGLRADRFISWMRARLAGVQLVTGADYNTMVSPAAMLVGEAPTKAPKTTPAKA